MPKDPLAGLTEDELRTLLSVTLARNEALEARLRDIAAIARAAVVD